MPRRLWLSRAADVNEAKTMDRSANFLKAPRCGAKNRLGQPCACPATRGKRRCRLHSGHSTGARTPEGLERIRRANTKHGRYSGEVRALHREGKQIIRDLQRLTSKMQ